jgi:hypothetical protein
MAKPSKLHVTNRAISVNSEGAAAIIAVFVIVISVLAFYHF